MDLLVIPQDASSLLSDSAGLEAPQQQGTTASQPDDDSHIQAQHEHQQLQQQELQQLQQQQASQPPPPQQQLQTSPSDSSVGDVRGHQSPTPTGEADTWHLQQEGTQGTGLAGAGDSMPDQLATLATQQGQADVQRQLSKTDGSNPDIQQAVQEGNSNPDSIQQQVLQKCI